MRRPAAIAIVLTLCFTSAARAQLGFLDKVFANVSDVNVSYLIGRPLRGNELVSDNNGKMDMHGVGFEVAVDVGALWESNPHPTCLKPALQYTVTQREIRKADTTYIEAAKEGPIYPDSIKGPDKELNPKKKRRYDRACYDTPSIDAEVSLGYSQMGGFTGRNVRLQGSLENLPAIGFYTVWSTQKWVNPYIAVRTGLAQLKGFQAFPSDTGRLTATGSTWQIGIAPGMSVGAPDFNGALFVEFEWMYREFEDIQWTSVIGPVSPELRRPTHLSTFVISLGGQVGIGKKD